MKTKSKIHFSDQCAHRDADGRVIINMNVKDDSDFLSVYSTTRDPVISEEIAVFLQSNTHSASAKDDITLRIYSDKIDNTEKTIYEKAIKKYYSEKYVENERLLRRNNLIGLFLLFFGILVLASSIFITYLFSSYIWAEVIDIFAWVLVWEAADIIIFKNNELRSNKYRYKAFTNIKIEYYDI